MLKRITIFIILILSINVFASRINANFKILVNTGLTLNKGITSPEAILNIGTNFYKTINPYDKLNVNLGIGAEIGSHFTKDTASGVFSPYVSLEIKRSINTDTDVYGGINLGTSISFSNSTCKQTIFSLKNFIGLTFNDSVSIELGVGSPNTLTFGIGARIGI